MSTDATPVCMTRRTFLIAGAGGAAVAMFPKGSLKGLQEIQGAVTGQACNTQICLSPSRLPVSASAAGE